MIDFHVSRLEFGIIHRIVKRALKLDEHGQLDTMSTEMDIIACHRNGCPLDLLRLADAPDFDFVHDIWGIRRHINRKTGKLGDCFVPRFAASQSAAV